MFNKKLLLNKDSDQCDYYLFPTVESIYDGASYNLWYNDRGYDMVSRNSNDPLMMFGVELASGEEEEFYSPTAQLAISENEFTLYLKEIDEYIYGNQIIRSTSPWLSNWIVTSADSEVTSIMERYFLYLSEHVGETVSIGVILGSGGTPTFSS